MKSPRIQTADPNARKDVETEADLFIYDPADPAVQRLLAAGIPEERLRAADQSHLRKESHD